MPMRRRALRQWERAGVRSLRDGRTDCPHPSPLPHAFESSRESGRRWRAGEGAGAREVEMNRCSWLLVLIPTLALADEPRVPEAARSAKGLDSALASLKA